VGVGEYLHAHLPSSTLKILEVPGHCAHMSHPEAVIESIRDFLQKP
jgi:sigma-B regulation protein RsbQ